MSTIIIPFFVSVAAGIVSYYICKWLVQYKCRENSLHFIFLI